MAPSSPTPSQKRIFTLHDNCCFQLSIYICEKPVSLAYQEKKQSPDKPIITLKNLGECGHKKHSDGKPE